MAWPEIRARPAQRTPHRDLDVASTLSSSSSCAMNAPVSITKDARRNYVLAEFRCALIKARLAQLDIEAVACALRDNIITVDQAVAAFWDSEAVHFLGLQLNEAA
jgi:hypothetical protein